VPLSRQLRPRLIPCNLGRGRLPYQVASLSIQPFGHNRRLPKIGCGWVCPFFWGSWVPIEHRVAWAEAYLRSKWHLSPSSRLATTDIGRKLGGCVPLGERELGPHLTMSRSRGLPPARTKWQLDPCSRSATIDVGQKLGAPQLLGEGDGSP